MTLIEQTPLDGLFVLTSSSFQDERGLFNNLFRIEDSVYKRVWGERKVCQINASTTKNVGCIRGMHYQKEPFSEAKLIRCLSGSVFDIAVDLRRESKTYKEWYGIYLSSKNYKSIFIPENFAHGFQVIEPNSTLLYVHSANWSKDHEAGVRYNDSAFGIKWPLPPTLISQKDSNYPNLNQI